MHPEFSTNVRGAIIIYGRLGQQEFGLGFAIVLGLSFVGFPVYV